ncbi:hypothetical protein [Hymenobacter terricola]|uniref:hypothetical protein n=1 Tax=Hymenobacter terricola TaxID=2819236 RepID=UPI001B303C4F|nr:hypothetical protein [Hymenobacter terricola]
MATPPSTAHTVVQLVAGVVVVAVTAESAATRAPAVSAAPCAQATGLLKIRSSASNGNSRRPQREQPAGRCGRAEASLLVERLRVMKHLG